jgi:hypothetical protein
LYIYYKQKFLNVFNLWVVSMTTLSIFGDESGTLPLHEEDGAFVCATVATQGRPRRLEERSKNYRWLIEKLQQYSAHPFVAYIRPLPGYGLAVKSKLEKMDTMARSKKLLTGKHTYLPLGGIRFRNFVWMHCMLQAITQSFLSGLFRGSIDALEIVLDQKTLAPENRQLLIDLLRRSPALAQETLIRRLMLDADAVEGYLSNIKVDPSRISVSWSDDPGASGAQAGLQLAHYLAWHYRRDLEGLNKTHLEDELVNAGFRRFARDITEFVITPINRRSIENWKLATGLPEPGG